MTQASKPLVISCPEPRTLELIFTPEKLAKLRDAYRIVETTDDAFASLGTAPGGDPWVPGTGSDAAGENCPALLWATAETPGGTVSSPTQVLFFHDGTYLGTATAESYAYTQVVGSTDDSVSVEYRWLGEQDANCCPSGGPAVVTYSWDGSRVVMEQPLPQEMLDSYK